MRSYTVAAGAAMLASGANALLCGDHPEPYNLGGNWYCKPVDAISYQNFAGSGTYQRVTNMNPSTGQCSSEPFGFSGSLGPLGGEVSFSMRGPMHLSQFAYYKPGKSASKRSAHQRRHGHAHFHGQNEARNAHNDSDKKEKRDEWITATINGQVVSWVNGASATAAAAPGSVPTAGASVGGTTGGTSGTSKPFTPSVSGDYVRAAHYRAGSGKAEGVTFLNNFGGDGSGTWDANFGNSLSYASADGQAGASKSTVLSSTVLPSNTEVLMFSDVPCSDAPGCGYSRPMTVDYHGFDNSNAVYLFQFSMPSDPSAGGYLPDQPALWMLNAEIPRTLQYGNPSCSAWKSGGGEFDIFETLDKGNTRCKSTLHSFMSAGSSDYFIRPEGAPIKVAVIMGDSTATIKVLPDDYDFSETLTNEDVSELGSSGDAGGLLGGNLGSSVFDMASQATSGVANPLS